MSFIYNIEYLLNDVSSFFYDVYLECFYSYYIPNIIGDIFYEIHLVFSDLAWQFFYFADWVDYITYKIEGVISEWDIFDILDYWLDKAEKAWNWISDAWGNVTNIINDWWEGQLAELKEWWEDQLAELEAVRDAWNHFWTTTLPNLITFTWLDAWWSSRLLEFQEWFNSELQELLPFYNDFMELWEGIRDFFIDPLQWLYDKMDEWFDRFW